MTRYQTRSKRKHFYVCEVCALVYISANALRAHYSSLHPNLPCDAVEIESDESLLEESPDDGNLQYENNDYLFKEDMYSIGTSAYSLNTNEGIANVNQINMNNGLNPAHLNINLQNTAIAANVMRGINAAYIQPATSIQYTPAIGQASFAVKPNLATMTPVLTQNLIDHRLQENLLARKTTPLALTTKPPTYAQLELKHTTLPVSKEREKKVFLCDICQKSFSTLYNKRRHEEMVHKDNIQVTRKYKCSSCDKMFSSIYNKRRHEEVHKPITERLKYKCVIDNCNKSFTTTFILKTHIKKSHKLDVTF